MIHYRRMIIEVESPEERGDAAIRHNLAEGFIREVPLAEVGVDLSRVVPAYGDHAGMPDLRALVAAQHGVAASDVIVTGDAAMAQFIVATSLLRPASRGRRLPSENGATRSSPQGSGCLSRPSRARSRR